MFLRDRVTTLLLLAFGAFAWIAFVSLAVTHSPREGASTQALGAVLLGLALTATAAPLLWLAAFGRRRIAYRGAWLRAARRAAWIGGGAALFVLLRGLGAFSPPLALFVVVMVVFVELTLTLRR